MGRRRRDKLGIDYIGGLNEESTAFAGVGLLLDVFRQAGIGATAEKVLPQKLSPKGLRQGQMVEAFVVLSSLGGECLDDMERLRRDKGLASLLEYTPPAAETARQWLDRFHDESLMAGRPIQGSFIPAESGPLAGAQGNKPAGYLGLCQGQGSILGDNLGCGRPFGRDSQGGCTALL